MSNTEFQNAFDRAKRPRKKVGVETSIGQWLTNFRSNKKTVEDGVPRNRWGNASGELTQRKETDKEGPVTRVFEVGGDETPRTQGGNVMDQSLIQAKAAEDARRVRIAADRARPRYEIPSVEDITAIAEAFVARHRDSSKPDFFVTTEYNMDVLRRALEYNCGVGNCWWNSAGFEACHKMLCDGGYYEKSLIRRRGGPAPRELLIPATNTVDPDAKRPIIQTIGQHRNEPEYHELKNMDFDALQALAREDFKRR